MPAGAFFLAQKVRLDCPHARRGLFGLKKSALTAHMPAGAFFCLKKSVLTAHMPVGAYFWLKKSVLTAYMPAGAFLGLKKSVFLVKPGPGAIREGAGGVSAHPSRATRGGGEVTPDTSGRPWGGQQEV